MRNLMFITACAMALSMFAFGASGQESADATEAAARELLEASGGEQMGLQVMQQLLGSFKSTRPEVPQEFWDEFMKSVDPDELVELVVPIYVKHLTKEEMEAATAFYRTPEGAAILAKLPLIVQESMMVGQQWGGQLAEDVVKRLQERSQSESEPTDG